MSHSNPLKHGRTPSSAVQASAPKRFYAKEPTPPATLAAAIQQIKTLQAQLDTVLDFVEVGGIAASTSFLLYLVLLQTNPIPTDAPAAVKAIILSRDSGFEALASSIARRMNSEYSKLCGEDSYGTEEANSDDISAAMVPFIGEIAGLAKVDHPKAVERAYGLLNRLRTLSHGDMEDHGSGYGDRPSDKPADELLARLVGARAAAVGALTELSQETYLGRVPNTQSRAWFILQQIWAYAEHTASGLYPEINLLFSVAPQVFMTYKLVTPLAKHLTSSEDGVIQDVSCLVRDIPELADWQWLEEYGERLDEECPRFCREGKLAWLASKKEDDAATKIDRETWAWARDLEDIECEAKHLDDYGIESWYPRTRKALGDLHVEPWYPQTKKAHTQKELEDLCIQDREDKVITPNFDWSAFGHSK